MNHEDDLAPRDYSFAPSVSEGVRRERAQKIHRDPAQNGLARPPLSSPRPLMPKAANPVDEYGIPEDPFHPPEETQRPRRSRVARHADMQPPEPGPPVPQPAPERPMTGARMAAPAQPQFARPQSPEIPEWLKVAQQNNAPMPPRPQGPRVQAAKRQMQAYEQAGYPEELLNQQRAWEQQSAATPVRRRHGAQYAVKPVYEPPVMQRTAPPAPAPLQPPQPAPPPTEEALMSRAYHRPRRAEPEPYAVEDDEEEERAIGRVHIPWLAIAAFAAVLFAVVLWIMQSTYARQTQQVLDQRAAQEAQILEAHPLKYRELISDKANKYNLHPAFVAAIMLNESSFRPDATAESTGARGLMQLMNDTAEWIHSKMDTEEPFSFDSMYDPVTNAEFGCWYLGYLSEMFRGDPVLVAAAFHAGQGEVRNWLNTAEYSPDGRTVVIDKIPFSDTRRYVTRVMNAYAAYLRIYYGG